MLAGISTRRFARTGEPMGSEIDEEAASVSKSAGGSAASSFRAHPGADGADGLLASGHAPQGPLLHRRGWASIPTASSVRWAVGRLDGERHRGDRGAVQTRRARPGQGVLCVLDGAKALRKGVRDVLGTDTTVQRCIRHSVWRQFTRRG